MKQLLLLLLVLTINLLVNQCGPQQVTGGSEVWGKVCGKVTDENGNAIANASVQLYTEIKDTLNEAIDFTTANEKGEYTFTDIKTGLYSIQGAEPNSKRVFLHRNLEHDSLKGSIDLSDTVKIAGELLVIFKNAVLVTLDGIEGFIPGTSYHNRVNNDTLRIAMVASGKYICKVATQTLGYSPVVTDSFLIRSGNQTVITIDLKIDPNGAPPAPKNLKFIGIIDTVLGKVVLKWDSVKVSDLRGYIILGGVKEDFLQPIHTTKRTIDTVDLVVDTTGRIVVNYFQIIAEDTLNAKSVEGSNIINVPAPSPKSVKTIISYTFITPHTELYIGDTARIIVSLKNAGRIIDSVTWALGKSDSIVKRVHYGDTTHMCSDTMIMVWKDSLEKTWYITAYDNSGNKDSIVQRVNGSGMYHPDTWLIFQAPNPAVKQTLTAVSDGKKIFLMGGYTEKISNPGQPSQKAGSDTITFFSPDSFDGYHYAKMSSKRYYHSSVFYNGKIYSIGGMVNRTSFSTIEMFDPVTNQSVTVDTLPYILYSASVAVYGSNFVITGGIFFPHPDSTEKRITGSIDKYDISLLTNGGEPLSTLGTMFIARKNHSTVVCGSKLIIMGGYDSTEETVLHDVESIDLETKEQKVLAPMTDRRSLFAAVAISDKVYVFGGWGDGVSLNTVETFDTKNSSGWKFVTPMKNKRYWMAATVHKNKVYIAGGTLVNSDGKTEADSTISIYYP